jgi:uncharacterized protein DUF4760
MPLEVLSTAASIGTFVVIGGTAVAALIQLRHTRSSNQIAALTEVRATLESERFTEARRFVAQEVPKLLSTSAGRAQLGAPPPMPRDLESIRVLANFFENVGAFVRHGIIDRELACALWGGVVLNTWEQLEPVVAIRRHITPGVWEHFEYLTVLAQEWIRRHPHGSYPGGVRRVEFSERSRNAEAAWLAEQQQKAL